MSQKDYFHFSLGPVQGFVAQARRTRDFWAGSFLLSWLTARAMHAVEQNGGKIVMPFVTDDKLLARVRQTSGKGPDVSSLPNNFIAEIPEGFDGEIATRAVQDAWKALADAVWHHDKLGAAGVSTELWKSQITSFWDMVWVIAESNDGSVLAQRKNWRNHMPPETTGDKCTMMGEWQELSGAKKPVPKQQREFWKALKKKAGISDIELRGNERLCAITYVKRRFVHAWQQLAGHQGWKLPTSVPSTSYMAAVHWLEALIKASPGAEEVEDLCKRTDSGERQTRIRAISNALGQNPVKHLRDLADIDGRALFDSDRKEDEKIVAAKKAVLETVAVFDVPLSPFYAILLMDGDSLGETKAAMSDATALSAALGQFTGQVSDIVEEHNGFLVYAGGDDVLAMLSLEDALPCAAALRKAYMDVFAGKGLQQGKYSISAAIEYAHMKLPLTMVLKDAHILLDDVAKDATGRDAIACRIWKPGGIQQTWSMPWNEALEGDAVKMVDLSGKLGKDKTGDPGYTSKLLYHCRETLDMLRGGSYVSKGHPRYAHCRLRWQRPA